jgi:hypothetical protein
MTTLPSTAVGDRVTDLTTLTTWEQFERFRKREFLARVAETAERFGS